MAANTVVERYAIDGDGVASVTIEWYREQLAPKLDAFLKKYGSTPYDIYKGVRTALTYKAMDGGACHEENALYALDYGKGACYQYAALTYLLLERAGYEVRYVVGTGRTGLEHNWVMAKFDGGWYHVDSVYYRCEKLTTAEIKKLNYKWDETGLPGA